MPDTSSNERRALQQEELNILRTFKGICEKHGLRYYVVAGTLLGAVRHRGFIPWDDDVDVAMPRADYEKLARIAKTDFPSTMIYQSDKTERECPFGFAKIRSADSNLTEKYLGQAQMTQGCFIDVFPLDKCPKSDKRATRYFKLNNMCFCAMLSKLDKSFKHGYTKGGVVAIFKLLRLFPLCIIKSVRRAIRRYYALTSDGTKLATTGGSYGYPKECYRAEWLGKGEELVFEGERFNAPEKWHEVLTHMYGNYMTPPDEDRRGGHFNR